MKYLFASLLLASVLVSGKAVAQSVPAQTEIINQVTDKRPLIILQDGAEYYKLANSAINEIDPEWVEQAKVLKDTTATAGFGEAGKDGVVILYFKDDLTAASAYLEKVKANNEKVKSPMPAGIFKN